MYREKRPQRIDVRSPCRDGDWANGSGGVVALHLRILSKDNEGQLQESRKKDTEIHELSASKLSEREHMK
jgi:hypothetical protein